MIAAYQGTRGAYSEAAVRRRFGARATALPCALSEEVFDAVESGRADFGVVPVENTIAGAVTVNGDLLAARPVVVVGEVLLRIDHCLLAPRGTRASAVRRALSHPVALAQCRAFLESRGIRAVPEFDTAGAAALVARRRARGDAAIASEACAKAYGLKVLARRIQTHRENITRFLVFVRPDRAPRRIRKEKTSVIFTTRHRPGALLHCLQRLAREKVSLTRLESRPIPENPFAYLFHADLLGGEDSPRVKRALAALGREARSLKVLGSYPKARL